MFSFSRRTPVFVLFTFVIIGFTTTPPTSPSAHTGAPGELTCARSGCHSGTINSGSGMVQLSFPDTVYKPDTTYTINISVNEAGKSKFGFQLTVLDSLNNPVGFLNSLNTVNTNFTALGNGKEYVAHKNAGSNNTWSFEWQTPSEIDYFGKVTFYYSGLAANNNGNPNGDNVYVNNTDFLSSKRDTIIDSITTSIPNGLGVSDLNIYPNPTNGLLFFDNNFELEVKIIDAKGQVVLYSTIAPNQPLDISSLNAGIYMLSLKNENRKFVKF